MTFLVVVDTTPDNRIAKMQKYSTREEANAHVVKVKENYPNAFVVDNYTRNSFEHTTVDVIAKTIAYDSAAFEIDKTMSAWKLKMAKTDPSMPRYLEDLITAGSLTMNEYQKPIYDVKIKRRSEKP
jgi:hypothetical protein